MLKMIDWTNLESRAIVIDDLNSGMISLNTMDEARDLYYGMYQFMPKFISEQVPYDQFRAHLNDHQKQIKAQLDKVSWEMAALGYDCLLCPKKMHNAHGEKVFYLTKPNKKLTKDI